MRWPRPQGSSMAKQISAPYIECSAQQSENSVRDIFHVATLACINKSNKNVKRSKTARANKRISHMPGRPDLAAVASDLRKDKAKSCSVMWLGLQARMVVGASRKQGGGACMPFVPYLSEAGGLKSFDSCTWKLCTRETCLTAIDASRSSHPEGSCQSAGGGCHRGFPPTGNEEQWCHRRKLPRLDSETGGDFSLAAHRLSAPTAFPTTNHCGLELNLPPPGAHASLRLLLLPRLPDDEFPVVSVKCESVRLTLASSWWIQPWRSVSAFYPRTVLTPKRPPPPPTMNMDGLNVPQWSFSTHEFKSVHRCCWRWHLQQRAHWCWNFNIVVPMASLEVDWSRCRRLGGGGGGADARPLYTSRVASSPTFLRRHFRLHVCQLDVFMGHWVKMKKKKKLFGRIWDALHCGGLLPCRRLGCSSKGRIGSLTVNFLDLCLNSWRLHQQFSSPAADLQATFVFQSVKFNSMHMDLKRMKWTVFCDCLFFFVFVVSPLNTKKWTVLSM